METNKKHILSSFKNEQEAIDEIEGIKFEKEHPLSTNESGYNVDFNNSAANASSSGNGDPAASQEMDSQAERPLPERIINNRIR